MDFYEPQPEPVAEQAGSGSATQSKDGTVTDANNQKTEETVQQLEAQVDKAYTAVETQVAGLWKNASSQASELQEKYKLEEHRKQLVERLNSTATTINQKAHLKENLQQIEDQLKSLSLKIPKDIDLKSLQEQANNALDTLDSKLEIVEREAGKYVSLFASFFSGIVSVGVDNVKEPVVGKSDSNEEPETLFSTRNVQSYGTSRYDADLLKLHTTATYFTEGTTTDGFKVESKTEEISNLLSKYPDTLEKLMNKLVPVEVSYETFWNRYFTADGALKESESKRKELLEKKKSTEGSDDEDDEEEFTWDDDEDEDEDEVVAKD